MRIWRPALFVLLLILIIGSAATKWIYDTQREELVQAASEDLSKATDGFVLALEMVFQPALAVSAAVKDAGLIRARDDELQNMFFAAVTGQVEHFDQVNGAFLGLPDGRFFHVQDLAVQGGGQSVLHRRVIGRHDEDRRGKWSKLDSGLGRWIPQTITSNPYDPIVRPWYLAAEEERKPIWTEPYVFSSSKQLGVTYARPLYNRDGRLWGVVGVDLSLASLSRTLVQTSEVITGSTDLVFATDFADRILGHPDFVEREPDMTRDMDAFLDRYQQAARFENNVVRLLDQAEDSRVVSTPEGEFLAARAVLDPTASMPLKVFLARDMQVLMKDATQALQRNVIILIVLTIAFAAVASYAARLHAEVLARKKAERELLEAKEVAESATKAKSVFLATMSHEIRTPMNGVMSLSELLTLTKLDAEQRRLADVIHESAATLLGIINDILDFSKIEAGKLDIETVSFSLHDVLFGAAELLAGRLADSPVEFVVHMDPALDDQRLGDPTRLRQILINLGGNAVKFTETGHISVTVTCFAGDRIRFSVKDSGIGMTEEQQANLFQAFVQADSSTSRKYGGTGLGLSICRTLTELMQGEIGVNSQLGDGSEFWFELPLPVAEPGARRYDGDLSGVSLQLVGVPERTARCLQEWARAVEVSISSEQADLNVVELSAVENDPSLVATLSGKKVLLGARDRLTAAPAALLSAFDFKMTTPIVPETLFHLLAVTAGLESNSEAIAVVRDDMAFSAPDVEQARAATALVLVAEDNATNQVVIRKMLDRMGIACEVAENGRVALEMMARPGYGLLLTDFNMPEMDGVELTRHLRDQGVSLPIFALTADAMAETEALCRDAGMDGFLTKPIESRKLSSLLAEHLPQALPLRKAFEEPTADPEVSAEQAKTIEVTWDPDIFDPSVLAGPFGAFDEEAKQLLTSAMEKWPGRISAVAEAETAKDWGTMRDLAHSLKGAALSVGVNRLGTVASDLQDALDEEDHDMAEIYASLLQPTLQELEESMPTILAA